MISEPKYPWRLDTNDRYRELVSAILSLSTAALLLPVFFAREFLGVSGEKTLAGVFSCEVYLAWTLLGMAVLSCICFFFFSAKWARLAWNQPVGLFTKPISEAFVERALELFLWLAIIGFLSGVALTIVFWVSYAPCP
jgi:hypothetical protein